MNARSYGYYDPLAQALDVAGGRWALLIVRELMSGAHRYGELLDRLPGLGTARLAARLRELVAGGLIEAVDGYRLTPDGLALAPSLYALTRYGLRRLRPLPGTATVYRASFAAFALRALADAAPGIREPLRFTTEIDGESFLSESDARGTTTCLRDEGSGPTPDVAVHLDTMTALALATGRTTAQKAAAGRTLHSQATPAQLRIWAVAHGLRFDTTN